MSTIYRYVYCCYLWRPFINHVHIMFIRGDGLIGGGGGGGGGYSSVTVRYKTGPSVADVNDDADVDVLLLVAAGGGGG